MTEPFLPPFGRLAWIDVVLLDHHTTNDNVEEGAGGLTLIIEVSP